MKIVVVSSKNRKYKKMELGYFVKLIKKGLIKVISFKKCQNIDLNTVLVEKIDSLKLDFDIYVLIIDNIDEVFYYKNKIKDFNKILILTENTNVNFIMSCIDYTKNLLYLNTSINTIINKIKNMYFENNEVDINVSDKYGK